MRIRGTLFACFPPRPWCRTKPVARSRVCCVPPSWSARPNQTTARDMCTPDPSRQRRLRRAGSSWQPAQHHSGTAAAGCPLPASMQQMQPALLQPQQTCLPACWSRVLMLYAAYDACLRKLRVCAAMHGCTHTVLVSTYSVSVVRHVLPIRIAPKTSSPCCKVAAVDLIGRLCYRLAVTFGAVSAKIFMTAPRFLDGIVFKGYEIS